MAKKSGKKKKDTIVDINQALLDNLDISNPPPAPTNTTKDEDDFDKLLSSFIDSEDYSAPAEKDNLIPASSTNDTPQSSVRKDAARLDLASDEKELSQAYANFLDAVTAIASTRNISCPEFGFKADMLMPNYKPSVGKKIIEDVSLCWDIMLQAFPERLSLLNPRSSDEQLLTFAEGLTDQNLQLSIISYVEILIDIENCEISYEEKRLKAQRRRIERELYEEYQRRKERKQKFIEEIRKRDFPIDAERLINNYFKAATKDVDGAFEALTKNPAVYAPIETNRIKPRFFGLVKVTPKDGIRENHRLGEFLKHLKA